MVVIKTHFKYEHKLHLQCGMVGVINNYQTTGTVDGDLM